MGKRKRKMRSRAKRRRDKLNERNGVKQVQQRIQDQKNTDIDPAARDEESVIQAPTTSATAKIQDEGKQRLSVTNNIL